MRIKGNTIVNNVAGWSGGGISLQDTLRAEISKNYIVHNDSTATTGGLVVLNDSEGRNQPAGISTETHSTAMLGAIPGNEPTFSDPDMPTQGGQVNTIWENRSFYYDVRGGNPRLEPVLSQTLVGECPTGAVFWDLDTLLGGLSGSTSPDPGLANMYCNGGRSLTPPPGAMFPLPATDEGGNAWIDVRFGPLTRP